MIVNFGVELVSERRDAASSKRQRLPMVLEEMNQELSQVGAKAARK
jgi:hypothetical protein